jgi:hypothetical protein
MTPTLTTSLGVLEHGGKHHLVHHIAAGGERVGHLRHLGDGGRWRWVIGDAIGDEETKALALAVARLFLASTRAAKTSHRSVSASSRRPGAGPVEGSVRIARRPAPVAPAWHPDLVPGSPDWYRAGCPTLPASQAATTAGGEQ